MTINGQTTTAKEFAYDDCHKIYILESENDRDEARSAGYDILPIKELEETFNDSCGLQFISSWDLSKHFVDQFQDAEFED
jgi:hypothetical protein